MWYNYPVATFSSQLCNKSVHVFITIPCTYIDKNEGLENNQYIRDASRESIKCI